MPASIDAKWDSIEIFFYLKRKLDGMKFKIEDLTPKVRELKYTVKHLATNMAKNKNLDMSEVSTDSDYSDTKKKGRGTWPTLASFFDEIEEKAAKDEIKDLKKA